MRRRRPAPRESDGASLARLLRHRYGALVEELASEDSFVTRSMFGCLACYCHGRLKVVLADGDHPWDGVLVPTAVEHHASLRESLRALRVHPVLRKWLHLPAGDDAFEDGTRRIVELALADDPRVGVEPQAKARRRARQRVRSRPRRV